MRREQISTIARRQTRNPGPGILATCLGIALGIGLSSPANAQNPFCISTKAPSNCITVTKAGDSVTVEHTCTNSQEILLCIERKPKLTSTTIPFWYSCAEGIHPGDQRTFALSGNDATLYDLDVSECVPGIPQPQPSGG